MPSKQVVIIAGVILTPFLLFFGGGAVHQYVNKLQFENEFPDYVQWVEKGGSFLPKFHPALVRDKNRDQIVNGKTVTELKKWFPQMKHQSEYPENSYRNPSNESNWYWAESSEAHAGGWVIQFKQSKAETLLLIKG